MRKLLFSVMTLALLNGVEFSENALIAFVLIGLLGLVKDTFKGE